MKAVFFAIVILGLIAAASAEGMLRDKLDFIIIFLSTFFFSSSLKRKKN
jgi:hypothetical protein